MRPGDIIGAQIATANGETVTFENVGATTVYLSAFYDEQGGWTGTTAVPSGSPAGAYPGGRLVRAEPHRGGRGRDPAGDSHVQRCLPHAVASNSARQVIKCPAAHACPLPTGRYRETNRTVVRRRARRRERHRRRPGRRADDGRDRRYRGRRSRPRGAGGNGHPDRRGAHRTARRVHPRRRLLPLPRPWPRVRTTSRSSCRGSGLSSARGVIIEGNRVIRIDAALEVATLAETVTVTGDAPVVDIRTTALVNDFGVTELQEVPSATDVWAVLGQTSGGPDAGLRRRRFAQEPADRVRELRHPEPEPHPRRRHRHDGRGRRVPASTSTTTPSRSSRPRRPAPTWR